ncbi:hypothetical protein BK007_00590 [Methanobacterium subterraneum]|uniref:Uncharacterized protein n=1 Tax=Methanobacterium subterraneum TaxID=59277 RepID=A0A2H4V9A1_9EURY|nr:hypothetical protein BK007_00590 [Methanobacterium subterraneum]
MQLYLEQTKVELPCIDLPNSTTKRFNCKRNKTIHINKLRPNKIVFLVMNGENKYIIQNKTNTPVYLADPPILGNIERIEDSMQLIVGMQ